MRFSFKSLTATLSCKTFLGMLAWSLYLCFAWGYYFDRNVEHAIRHCAETWPYFVALILILVVSTGRGLFLCRLIYKFTCGFLTSGIVSIAAAVILLTALIYLKPFQVPLYEWAWLKCLQKSFGFGGMVVSWIAAFLILGKSRIGFRMASFSVKARIICGAMFVFGAIHGGLHEMSLTYVRTSWPFNWF